MDPTDLIILAVMHMVFTLAGSLAVVALTFLACSWLLYKVLYMARVWLAFLYFLRAWMSWRTEHREAYDRNVKAGWKWHLVFEKPGEIADE